MLTQALAGTPHVVLAREGDRESRVYPREFPGGRTVSFRGTVCRGQVIESPDAPGYYELIDPAQAINPRNLRWP